MKLYLDMNVYNRLFDDQNQLRIRFETMAIDIIIELVEKEMHILVWSFILQDENRGNPYSYRKDYIEMLSKACKEVTKPNIRKRESAQMIMNESKSKVKDALHLACAIHSGCDCFITCDDRLIRTLNANRSNISKMIGNMKILNPIEFLREEMKINVVE